MAINTLQGDVLDKLAELPDKSVHCIVTSPPYWGLRSYLHKDDPLKAFEIGCEKTPEEYVAKMVAVFREAKRVLRDDGVCFLNLGDSYAGSGVHAEHHANPGKSQSATRGCLSGVPITPGLKPKDLCGIPWRVALALQADGWYLRSDIIWFKRNPMPESVTDRPTKAHEYIFLLTKSQRYFYDAEAVKEESGEQTGMAADFKRETKDHVIPKQSAKQHRVEREQTKNTGRRNLRSVWDITTKGYLGAHFATFPPELPERCIKAGTSEKGVCSKCGAGWVRVVEREKHPTRDMEQQREKAKERGVLGGKVQGPEGMIDITKTLGWSPACKCNTDTIPATVLDCFGGSGTTGEVAERLGRNAILIELNPKYIPLIQKRTHHTNMFAS